MRVETKISAYADDIVGYVVDRRSKAHLELIEKMLHLEKIEKKYTTSYVVITFKLLTVK